MAVNKDVIRLWVDELRSGKREQGVGLLHRKSKSGDQYCCLGVLCELAAQNRVEVEVTDYSDAVAYDGNEALLPDSVTNWVGFDTSSPKVMVTDSDYESNWTFLSVMNDQGVSFVKIADAIEKEYLQGV